MAWCWARRPPGSAVLPGALAGQGQEELRGGEASSGEGAGDRTRHLLGFSSLDHGDRGAAEAASGHAGSMCTDRKSTRLNSSHVASSYAVFCLHKKSWKSYVPRGKTETR